MEKKHGFVHLYTGEGEGKTITAFGLALRALGHGHKVVVIQFLKGRKYIGEYKIKKRLGPNYEIYQFGRKRFIDLRNPDPIDIELAYKGLEFARNKLQEKPKLLILDEVNLVCAFGLLKVEDVLGLLDEVAPETVVVLTGRRAPQELIERADLVSEIMLVKHPFQKGVPARAGIEY
jgi:cob(I)alamin adenosyltransferase